MSAGDRHFTPWLKVLGRGAPKVPMVKMHLASRGSELASVQAEVMNTR